MTLKKKPYRMILFVAGALLSLGLYIGWKTTSRTAYESAAYTVLEQEDDFEIREYPDLMLATTNSQLAARGDDGSFRRLFDFISGENAQEQKIAMTTPVFMAPESTESNGQMSFILPKELAQTSVPEPTNRAVQITERTGGRFAVIRFSGRMNQRLANEQEAKLREWIESKGLDFDATAELAGYDPPWTPGPFRRNEVLIRIR